MTSYPCYLVRFCDLFFKGGSSFFSVLHSLFFLGVSTNGPSELSSKDDVKIEGLHINGPTTGKKPHLVDFDTNGFEPENLSNHSKLPHSNARHDLEDANERPMKRRRINSSDKECTASSEIFQETVAHGNFEDQDSVGD